jgi:hypothetical protein
MNLYRYRMAHVKDILHEHAQTAGKLAGGLGDGLVGIGGWTHSLFIFVYLYLQGSHSACAAACIPPPPPHTPHAAARPPLKRPRLIPPHLVEAQVSYVKCHTS